MEDLRNDEMRNIVKISESILLRLMTLLSYYTRLFLLCDAKYEEKNKAFELMMLEIASEDQKKITIRRYEILS